MQKEGYIIMKLYGFFLVILLIFNKNFLLKTLNANTTDELSDSIKGLLQNSNPYSKYLIMYYTNHSSFIDHNFVCILYV